MAGRLGKWRMTFSIYVISEKNTSGSFVTRLNRQRKLVILARQEPDRQGGARIVSPAPSLTVGFLPLSAYYSKPTKTGSSVSLMPKASRTRAFINSENSITSRAVPLPRLMIAKACFVEVPTLP